MKPLDLIMPEMRQFDMPYTKPLRTTTSADGQIWFVGKDICDILEYSNHIDTIKKMLDEDEVAKFYLTDDLGRRQETNFINESGLYALIIRSNKPEARKFRKWITSEVLPSIRRTGKYNRKTINTQSREGRLVELINKRLSYGERREIAAALGMSINTICDNLTGRVRRPKLWRLQKMVEWLDKRDNNISIPLI